MKSFTSSYVIGNDSSALCEVIMSCIYVSVAHELLRKTRTTTADN